VSDLPHTKNGKLAEIAARDVFLNVQNSHTSALANPECLEEIRLIMEKIKA
jgi:hypothetical protein